jgi:hypothetical protein
METDIPLTDLFECPYCGLRGLFKAEPAAYVRCGCGGLSVIGDYNYYLSLTREERRKMVRWDVNLYHDQREVNECRFRWTDLCS